MLSSFNCPPTGAIVGIWGDSESDKDFPYQVFSPLIHACQAARFDGGATSIDPGAGTYLAPPTLFINNAVSGSTIGGVIGTFNGGVGGFASNAYTHVLMDLGTNERSVGRATTQTDITTLAGSIPAGIHVLLIGPLQWGGLYPGPNVIAGSNDTRLNETDTDLLTLFVASHANTLYISPRTLMWALQTPPGNTNGGPVAAPWTIDGVHVTPSGRGADGIWGLTSPYVTFNP